MTTMQIKVSHFESQKTLTFYHHTDGGDIQTYNDGEFYVEVRKLDV